MQYITFRLQTDCNQTFHPLSFSIKYALYFLYFYYPALPLGHLANMAALYSPSISRATKILFQTTGLAQKTVTYYAAQMNIVARTKSAT